MSCYPRQDSKLCPTVANSFVNTVSGFFPHESATKCVVHRHGAGSTPRPVKVLFLIVSVSFDEPITVRNIVFLCGVSARGS